MPRQRAVGGVWQSLDERERACLAAVYVADREQERASREHCAPADTWRWLPCAPDWPLHTRLERAGLLDAGTDATQSPHRTALRSQSMVGGGDSVGEGAQPD